jgi:transmembrane sensor
MDGAMTPDAAIRDAAIGWAMRTRASDFDDWDGFTAWLEADPAHAAAYDEVQLSVEEAHAALAMLPEPAVLPAANDNPGGWFTSRRTWLGGAVAAALALVVTSVLWIGPGAETYRTAPGETRSIELAGGSTLAVEGPRAARLEAGQALFTIRHDAADPFVLTAGGARLVDAGTVFDVRLAGETLDLAVSEGAVIVNPAAEAVRVGAGERAVRSGGRTRVTGIDPAAVGEWRQGRISFDNASLAEIAAELSRATGQSFASTDTATRRSGSIATAALRSDPRALEALLGVQVRAEGERWVIAAE